MGYEFQFSERRIDRESSVDMKCGCELWGADTTSGNPTVRL